LDDKVAPGTKGKWSGRRVSNPATFSLEGRAG
jgi:hypothetical protein